MYYFDHKTEYCDKPGWSLRPETGTFVHDLCMYSSFRAGLGVSDSAGCRSGRRQRFCFVLSRPPKRKIKQSLWAFHGLVFIFKHITLYLIHTPTSNKRMENQVLMFILNVLVLIVCLLLLYFSLYMYVFMYCPQHYGQYLLHRNALYKYILFTFTYLLDYKTEVPFSSIVLFKSATSYFRDKTMLRDYKVADKRSTKATHAHTCNSRYCDVTTIFLHYLKFAANGQIRSFLHLPTT